MGHASGTSTPVRLWQEWIRSLALVQRSTRPLTSEYEKIMRRTARQSRAVVGRVPTTR